MTSSFNKHVIADKRGKEGNLKSQVFLNPNSYNHEIWDLRSGHHDLFADQFEPHETISVWDIAKYKGTQNCKDLPNPYNCNNETW